MRSASKMVSFHLVAAFASARPSMSWKVPVMRIGVDVRPASSITGLPHVFATARPVIAFVTPGPAVTAATPGLPVTRA
jgi:hypothetical protein